MIIFFQVSNLAHGSLPPMNNIFSMVLQHERQTKFAIVDDAQSLINVVRYNKFNSKQGTLPLNTTLQNPKFALIMVEHTTPLKYVIGNMDFPLILVRIPWPIMLPSTMQLVKLKIMLFNNQLLLMPLPISLKTSLTNLCLLFNFPPLIMLLNLPCCFQSGFILYICRSFICE